MKLLIVSATLMEIEPLIKSDEIEKKNEILYSDNKNIDILISGVGQQITSFRLTKHLCFNNYDFAIMIGVCGSYGKYLVGEMVEIEKDFFADFGIMKNKEFIPIAKTDFFYDSLISNSELISERYTELPYVIGITVNTTTDSDEFIIRYKKLYSFDVESMEGASFFYVCKNFKLKNTQIRCVSNIIGNRNSFNIPLAIEILNKHIISIIKTL